ncbi:MAG: hypothetical protein JSR77_14555 [Planctomycetes bacterium]|nr:hypothetical protein [Planctomycetota bacterium]
MREFARRVISFPMRIVVSPYHLTTREAPAMAALLFAREAVTLLPAPLDGAGDARSALAAAGRVATYRAFMESWAWLQPLWRAGVLVSGVQGETPVGDMWDVGERIAREEALSALRSFSHERMYEDEKQYLGALAADLLKGGPDPGISVPLAAALDRFASRHASIVARSEARSVAQRAELKLGVVAVSAIVPMLVQASAPRLMHAREVLADVLSRLHEQPNAAAWAAYAQAFELRREEVLEGCPDDEVRAIEGAASISLVTLPGDAVLRSSLEALAALGPRRARAAAEPATLPVLVDPLDAAPITAMVVRVLGGRK